MADALYLRVGLLQAGMLKKRLATKQPTLETITLEVTGDSDAKDLLATICRRFDVHPRKEGLLLQTCEPDAVDVQPQPHLQRIVSWVGAGMPASNRPSSFDAATGRAQLMASAINVAAKQQQGAETAQQCSRGRVQPYTRSIRPAAIR